MRILYASDTHVFPPHMARLFRAAAHLLPEIVIMGGDIIPDWGGGIGASIKLHRAWIRDKFLPRLKAFKADFPAVSVLVDLGNDDIAAARELLEEKDGEDLRLLHMRVVKLNEKLAVSGYMNVNPTPFLIKDREKPDCRDRTGLTEPGVLPTGSTTITGSEERCVLDPARGTMEDDLEELSKVLESESWKNSLFLFVSHAPPQDSLLDRTDQGLHVGSVAVRRFIEKWGPSGRLVAALHGHIHESPWRTGHVWQEIANVPCFNIGQRQDILRAVLFDTENVVDSARLVLVGKSGDVVVREKGIWF